MPFQEFPHHAGGNVLVALDAVQSVRMSPEDPSHTVFLMEGRSVTVELPYSQVKEILKRDFYISESDFHDESAIRTNPAPGADSVDTPVSDKSVGIPDAAGDVGELPETEGEDGAGADTELGDGFDDLFKSVPQQEVDVVPTWINPILSNSELVAGLLHETYAKIQVYPIGKKQYLPDGTLLRRVDAWPDVYGWTQRCRREANLPPRRAVYTGFNQRIGLDMSSDEDGQQIVVELEACNDAHG